MTAYADLAADYDRQRSAYLADLGRAQQAQALVARLTDELTTAQQAALTDEQVALLYQAYSDAEHAQLTARIEALVTKGIESIFGPIYTFRVQTTAERGQAAVRFWLVDGEGNELPVMGAMGGGLASIIGFVLRVVVLVLRPSSGPRLLVLDETFGMVSADYHDRLALFLRSLVDDLDLQVVLITHAPEQGAYADRVYRVQLDGTASTVTEIGTEAL